MRRSAAGGGRRRGTAAAWRELEARIARQPPPGGVELDDQPAAVERYFRRALGPGTALPVAAKLEMRGRIRLGRWLLFRSRQLLAPRLGTVWAARVGGVLAGSDRYVAGVGAMDWRLFGLVPVLHAGGPDVTRSVAGRAAGEAIWVPSAVLPGPGVEWTEHGEEITGTFDVDGHPHTVHHLVGPDGTLRSSWLDRWGDPDRTGTWAAHPFGVEVTGHRTFGSVTIPNRGRAGWHPGTDRWPDSVFFTFEITRFEPVPSGAHRLSTAQLS